MSRRKLRTAELNIDFSIIGRKGFGDQLKYAERRGIPVAVIVGPDEVERGEVTVKHLHTGDQERVPIDDLADRIPPDEQSRLMPDEVRA